MSQQQQQQLQAPCAHVMLHVMLVLNSVEHYSGTDLTWMRRNETAYILPENSGNTEIANEHMSLAILHKENDKRIKSTMNRLHNATFKMWELQLFIYFRNWKVSKVLYDYLVIKTIHPTFPKACSLVNAGYLKPLFVWTVLNGTAFPKAVSAIIDAQFLYPVTVDNRTFTTAQLCAIIIPWGLRAVWKFACLFIFFKLNDPV